MTLETETAMMVEGSDIDGLELLGMPGWAHERAAVASDWLVMLKEPMTNGRLGGLQVPLLAFTMEGSSREPLRGLSEQQRYCPALCISPGVIYLTLTARI